MRIAVTGVAGFIGSSLTEQLLSDGHQVLGLDRLSDYYSVELKRRYLQALQKHDEFTFLEADLCSSELGSVFEGSDLVFHQAAQAGVRPSWSSGFSRYCDDNILATQRVLEGARDAAVGRVIYASSSSVYGNAPQYPTSEDLLPQPHSPYGVSKLAAEHLCGLYAANFAVHTVSLRYFTVYGPRQRPDMAIHRLVEAALTGKPFPLYGTGEQVRDFTFVGDVIRANIAAAQADVPAGSVFNVAGGGAISMADLIDAVSEATGFVINIDRQPSQRGDVDRTGGTIDKAQAYLDWEPDVDVLTGVQRQIDWHRNHRPWLAES